QVLGLTFTTKAAGELGTRVRIRLAQLRAYFGDSPGASVLAGEPTVATYHAYAGRLVAEHALRLGVEPSVRLLTEAMTWQLAQRVVRTYDLDVPELDYAESTVVGWVLDLAGELAEHLVGPDELRRWTARLVDRIGALPRRAGGRPGPGEPYADVGRLVARARSRTALLPLVERYARAKTTAGAMDFGDQVAIAARVADAFAEVGRGERSRYAVVLLDEYQDTSHAQLTLLRALYGAGHPVTAVGDPAQAIYGWRGASAANLRRFAVHFPTAAGQPAPVLPLSVSFRNDALVLDVANELSDDLREHGIDVGVLVPGPRGGHGEVSCALVETVLDEAEWVATQLAEVWREDTPKRRGGRAGRSVAVLCRRRSQFEPVARALRARGIPVELVGLGGLLATPEVRDLVSTLQVVADPTASAALARLLTGARWRIGPRDLAALGRRARSLAARRRDGAGAEPAAGGPGDPGEPPVADHQGAAPGERPAADRPPVPDEVAVSGGPPAADQPAAADQPLAADRPPVPDEVADASLVEALDDLGAPDPYSPEGYRRLAALGRELAALRRRTAQPLPDLVADVERTLLLDVEVAAAPDRDRAVGRAHLDRFADVAAAFSMDAEAPTLGAFLAYLTAAEEAERGLEAGVVEVETGRVQVLTVHAAKGLEWDVVAVPGLTVGVFPDRDAAGSSGWATSIATLPYPLRGDGDDLPVLDLDGAADQKDLDEARKRFVDACRERGQREERRLAYVAVTRARQRLLCSGYWWDQAVRPRGPSTFLEEMRRVRGVRVDQWLRPPVDGATNPLPPPEPVPWPIDPLGGRRPQVEQGAALVRSALASPAGAGSEEDALFAEEDLLALGWARDAELLLAERAREAAGPDTALDVPLPGHLSVTDLVSLARDPVALARRVRRPVPTRPAPLARRGTAFHAWLEERYGGERLLDLDELPGAADSGAAPDEDLALLQERFLASAWADRSPEEVEVPFETVIGGVVVRGRIDAVFADDEGGWTVVDW
ncbi:MAG TPA: ATP-dependent DNA helicase, partial [Mycobacteriales bacterium]|nr:ATP-dependent DNA helicase [Mycobacteriales bacterium]